MSRAGKETRSRERARRAAFGLAAALGLAGLAGVLALVALAAGIFGPDRAATDGQSAVGKTAASGDARVSAAEDQARERVRWRNSEALGSPAAGQLRNGVRLPQEGGAFFTWDPVKKEVPNRSWRLWGTDRAVRMVLRVLRDFARENPSAPPVGVGDLSRRNGGDFGADFGKLGHASHQNGLDIDVYYPRLDSELRRARTPGQVDRSYAQDLVDRFVAAGADKLFVGPNVALTGPSGVVIPLVNHDDHVHVRLASTPSPAELA